MAGWRRIGELCSRPLGSGTDARESKESVVKIHDFDHAVGDGAGQGAHVLLAGRVEQQLGQDGRVSGVIVGWP